MEKANKCFISFGLNANLNIPYLVQGQSVLEKFPVLIANDDKFENALYHNDFGINDRNDLLFKEGSPDADFCKGYYSICNYDVCQDKYSGVDLLATGLIRDAKK